MLFRSIMDERDDKKIIRYMQLYPESDPGKQPDGIFSNEEEYLLDFMNFVYNWKAFCDFAKSHNIKLFFSTWSSADQTNLKDLELFDNYIYQNENMLAEYFLDKKLSPTRKRDGHHGVEYHEFWADLFFSKFNSNEFDF